MTPAKENKKSSSQDDTSPDLQVKTRSQTKRRVVNKSPKESTSNGTSTAATTSSARKSAKGRAARNSRMSRRVTRTTTVVQGNAYLEQLATDEENLFRHYKRQSSTPDNKPEKIVPDDTETDEEEEEVNDMEEQDQENNEEEEGVEEDSDSEFCRIDNHQDHDKTQDLDDDQEEGVSRGHSGIQKRKRGRNDYSPEENRKLLKNVIKEIRALESRGQDISLGGNVFWRHFEGRSTFDNRTWQSLRDHFLKAILRMVANEEWAELGLEGIPTERTAILKSLHRNDYLDDKINKLIPKKK